MTDKELAAHLKALTDAGPGLRAAGFVHIEVGEIRANLVPMAGSLLPVPPKPGERKESADDYDPLNDPVTYGLQPGDPLPWDSEDEDTQEGDQ